MLKVNEEWIDACMLQANICKNYFAMAEMYLGLVRTHLTYWHTQYIIGK